MRIRISSFFTVTLRYTERGDSSSSSPLIRKTFMSRFMPAEELNLIERVISEHPEGIGISALEKALHSHLPSA